MSINKNLAAAALAGLMSSTLIAPTFACDQSGLEMAKAEKSDPANEKNACKSMTSCKGKNACASDKGATGAKEKHACKGMNSCKGNSPDGKNTCKGKSACATDGSK
jgi:hypothetical protein